MKLRIHEDSIRFRLTRSEVEKLGTEGRVEGSVHFTADAKDALRYALEASSCCGEVRAQLTSNEIRVTVPASLAHDWAATGQVTIEHLQPIGPDAGLRILVEKDFRCIHRDETSEEVSAADFYPNPNDAVGSRE
jgi:hypothetical protein